MNCVLVCLYLGLSETRKMGCHIEQYSDYVFCYIGETKRLYGVRCLIRKAWKNNITNFTGISEQVAYMHLNKDQQQLKSISKRPSRRWTWKSLDEIVKNDNFRIQNYEDFHNVKSRKDHRLLKETVLLKHEPLTELYNLILETEIVPT